MGAAQTLAEPAAQTLRGVGEGSRSHELPEPPPRVLLGTAGTGTTWGIAVSLRERWGERVHVVGTDMLPAHLVASSALMDRFARMPAVADEQRFTARLLQLIEREGIDTYVPTFDREIVLAAALREQGRMEGVRVLAPPLWSAQTCLDKRAMSAWLEREGIAAPRTLAFRPQEWCERGIVVKPRTGVGSVGVERLREREAWEAWCGREGLREWIAQELVQGVEVTLDCFRSGDGTVGRVVCRERVEVKSGVCTKARVFEDGELAQLGLSIGEGLALSGAYCLQAMRCERRGWLVTDVNPRPGAGTRLSAALGVQLHAAMFADAWGLSSAGLLPRLARERWVARQYREIVLG
ncbi:MAG TPA: ATP-grasp domain-containing protein [Solirubrobacteraceae bacterium]|nr:ATP-grasp domain-containing protein [Solirubrobacteraceae bacterium]